MTTRRMFAAFLVIAGVVTNGWGCQRFVRVDTCLDRGGAFDYEQNACTWNADAGPLAVPSNAVAMEVGTMLGGIASLPPGCCRSSGRGGEPQRRSRLASANKPCAQSPSPHPPSAVRLRVTRASTSVVIRSGQWHPGGFGFRVHVTLQFSRHRLLRGGYYPNQTPKSGHSHKATTQLRSTWSSASTSRTRTASSGCAERRPPSRTSAGCCSPLRLSSRSAKRTGRRGRRDTRRRRRGRALASQQTICDRDKGRRGRAPRRSPPTPPDVRLHASDGSES
jgi:hypothetical protein